MEVITLLGVTCLVLILVSGITKGTRARRFARAIKQIKKTIEEHGGATEQMWKNVSDELTEVVDSLGQIEARAILDCPLVREFIRSLPSGYYRVPVEKRRELTVNAIVRLWAPRSSGSVLPVIGWMAPISIWDSERSLNVKPGAVSVLRNAETSYRDFTPNMSPHVPGIAPEMGASKLNVLLHDASNAQKVSAHNADVEGIERQQPNKLPPLPGKSNLAQTTA